MARVVGVHGIAQQMRGEQVLLSAWRPALADGLTQAAHAPAADAEVAMAFYGDLFRPPGELLAVGDPVLTAADVAPGLERELLLAWWRQAAAVDETVAPPDADTLVRTPASVQAALRQLSRSRFFRGRVARPGLRPQAGQPLPPRRRGAAGRPAAGDGPDHGGHRSGGRPFAGVGRGL
ncbi:hypothetical protein SMALB_0672 [Streptomyces malaysiensis]|uniref:Uncharacterized protein n=1 Tax=Streptomyces malaysiensis TaxID=92644 RepID=A0A7X6AVD4_STRMQ|nr:hypothetical protein [Streptomyces malaysiensis]